MPDPDLGLPEDGPLSPEDLLPLEAIQRLLDAECTDEEWAELWQHTMEVTSLPRTRPDQTRPDQTRPDQTRLD